MEQQSATSPVYAFLRNPTMIDFAGHVALMCFVSGCNFRCGFCHNPELMRARQAGLTWDKLAATCAHYREQWVDACVISGGEPTLWDELPDLIGFFKEQGWAVKLDTNGSTPEMLERCAGLIDYVAMDVKCSPATYPRLTGFSDIAKIRASIDIVKALPAAEFRTTVVDSVHTNDEMLGVAQLIEGARHYVLQPFVPKPELPDAGIAEQPRTSGVRLRELAELVAPFAQQVEVRG